jgi:hypothetical protein
MGEYSWPVKQIWFGVEGPKPGCEMLGIIKRSGQCRALGHFCHVKIPVNGKRVWASGAEDRTFYMHLVEWKDIGEKIPKDMIPALGWNDGNLYVFLHEGRVAVAGTQGTLAYLKEEAIREEWKNPAGRLTLIQRGAHLMVNHYIALMPEKMQPKAWGQARKEKPRVTLPVGCFNKERGEFEGLTGAVSIWNGPPPLWCVQVLEVKCPDSWIHVDKEHYQVLWELL